MKNYTLTSYNMIETNFDLDPLDYNRALEESVRVWAVRQKFRVEFLSDIPGVLTTHYLSGTRAQHVQATLELCKLLRSLKRERRERELLIDLIR